MAGEDVLLTGVATVLDPFARLGIAFMNILPQIVVAIIVLILGYFLSLFIGYLVKKVLEKIGLDKKLKQANLADAIGHVELSSLAGTIAKWYIFLWVIIQAAEIVQLRAFSQMLDNFVSWLPDVLLAIVIMILGLIIADVAYTKLLKTKLKSVRFVSWLAKVMIIFFVVVIALKQISLDITIVEHTFLMVLGAICVAFAIAMGLGFGAALKDDAKKMLKNFKKHF